MNHYSAGAVYCAALAALSVHTQVNAQTTAERDVTGPYIGVAYGAAFGNREIDDSNHKSDERIGRGMKLYGGYQLTKHFGIQAGYASMRRLNQDIGSGTTLVTQSASGLSLYVAGTARLPLGQSFALTTKAGISFGRVTDVHPSSAATDTLLGHKTSLLFGTGAEYVLNHNVAFSIELESYGRISDQVKANTLTVGTRLTF
jgi:OmpA-OmpF porin, OOP family